jgi:hypothetical protein
LLGDDLNSWVLDDGVKKYIAGVRRENFDYYLKGPSGPKLYAENQGVGDPKSLDVAANCLIFECKSFNLPGYDDPVNITSRRKTIGELMVSFPHVDVKEKYTSAQRDILAYDEDRDGFRKLCLREGLANCCRFDPDSGAPMFPHDFDGDDMFRRDKNTTLKYLGQMSDADLPDDAVRDWISSVVAGLDDASEVASGLNVLKSLVKKLDGAPTSNTDQLTLRYFKFIADAYGTSNNAIELDTDTRVPILSSGSGCDMRSESERKEKSQNTKVVPYGYGTYAGLKELAKDKYADIATSAVPRDYHDEAKIAIKAFDALFDRIESVCVGNAFVSAPPFFVERHAARAAVFFNIVHERLPPIVVKADRENYTWGSAPESKDSVDTLLEAGLKKMNSTEMEQARAVKGAVAKKIDEILATMKTNEKYFKGFVQYVQVHGEVEELWEGLLSGRFTASPYEICTALIATGGKNGEPTVAGFVEALKNKTEPVVELTKMHGAHINTQLTCSKSLREFLGAEGVGGCVAYTMQNEAMNIGAGEFDYGEASFSFGMRQSKKRDRELTPGLAAGGSGSSDPNFFKADVVDDDHMKHRLEKCDRTFASPLQRALAKAFLGTPINHHAFQAFIDADCVFPFNVRGCKGLRPLNKGLRPLNPLFFSYVFFRRRVFAWRAC